MTRAKRRAVEVRKEELLDATISLLENDGLATVRVADVARALEVSPALVFYHFGTKDALIAEAFAHAVEKDLAQLDAVLARTTDPLERLRGTLRRYGPTGTAVGWRLWIDAWALAQREPVIRQALRRLDRRWCLVLREIVEDGVAHGAFRCDDPASAVARVSALLDGLSVATLVYRSVTRRDLRSWIAEAVARELDLETAALL